MEPFRYPIPKCYPCDDVTKSASVGKKSVVTHKWPLTWQGRFTKMQSVFCRVLMLNHSMAYEGKFTKRNTRILTKKIACACW